MSKLTFPSLTAAALVGAATACGSTVDVDHYSGTDMRTVGADSLFTGIDRQSSGLTDSATYAIRTTAAPFAAVVVPTTTLSVHFVNRTGERRCS